MLYLRDRTKVVLRGQLVGEWVECLPRAIAQCCPAQGTVEIDLDGITCVDRAGEQVLLSLWRAHRRFLCTSPFARTLCECLRIPLRDLQESVSVSLMQCRGGTANYLNVLNSQSSLFSADLTLAQVRNNEYRSLVQLYKALGGGWMQASQPSTPRVP